MTVDADETTAAPRVALREISKRFGGTQANRGVNLDVRAGEVHALLGENGAGKSTLMHILSGVLQPDVGDILVDGQILQISSPKAALQAGIGMVHQHFRLLEGLSAAENICVGWDGTPRRFRHRRSVGRALDDIIGRFGIDFTLDTPVWQLSIAEKQQVEILRILVRDVRVVILDEPTAVLTPSESQRLFGFLRSLTASGTAVIFISHKLREVLEVADRITVMRAGAVVGGVERDGADASTLAGMMVGGAVERQEVTRSMPGGAVIDVSELTVLDDQRLPAIQRVDLTLRAGEVLAIAGVAGNGQRELAEALTGNRRPEAGAIRVAGSDLTGATAGAFARAGIGYVPEERKGTGLAPAATIWQNATLRRYRSRPINSHGLLRRRPARQYASKLAKQVRLSTADVDQPVRHLSGGHAQRLLVGREMDIAETACVLCYPSRGLDIAAVEHVRRQVLKARDDGKAVLLISEDLDEIFDLGDRIAVLYEGQIRGTFGRDEADRSTVGELMAGVEATR